MLVDLAFEHDRVTNCDELSMGACNDLSATLDADSRNKKCKADPEMRNCCVYNNEYIVDENGFDKFYSCNQGH